MCININIYIYIYEWHYNKTIRGVCAYIPNTRVCLTNLLVSCVMSARVIGTDACVLYTRIISSANGFGSLKTENTSSAEAAAARARIISCYYNNIIFVGGVAGAVFVVLRVYVLYDIYTYTVHII